MALVPEEQHNLVFEKDWREASGSFRMTLDQNHVGVTRFDGKGSMAGTRAFIAGLDEGNLMIGAASDVRALVDLSKLDGVPVRAQFMLGKWLLANKHRFYRIAVFGGKHWEMSVARAIAKIAGFQNIGFFDEENSSLGFLNG